MLTPKEIKAIKTRYRKQLDKAHIEIDNLTDQVATASRILNKIRELLITRTEWNGLFYKGEDLSDLVKEALEKGNVEARSV